MLSKILKEKISIFDMVSTLSYLTVECINLSLKSLPSYPKSVVISGGGSIIIFSLFAQKLKSKFLLKRN